VPHQDGLLPLLEALAARSIPCAVATSTQNPRATRKLEHGGILRFFRHVVTGDQVVRGKPAPDIYLRALGMLGVGAAEAVALEDSPNGLRAAHAAGLRTFLVPDLAPIPEEVAPLAFHRCNSLHEARSRLGLG
jgi:HAD superfamily hydrolase (TIGR01509 family)